MNAYLKNSLVASTVVGLSLVFVASSWAQSYLDGSSKARGDYGQIPRVSRGISQPMLQATAPSAQRSYSYEPAPAVKTDKDNGAANKAKSNPSPKANAAPNATAQRGTQSTRTFSYEPGAGMSRGTVRTGSSTPLYLLPKSDSRKFGGG